MNLRLLLISSSPSSSMSTTGRFCVMSDKYFKQPDTTLTSFSLMHSVTKLRKGFISSTASTFELPVEVGWDALWHRSWKAISWSKALLDFWLHSSPENAIKSFPDSKPCAIKRKSSFESSLFFTMPVWKLFTAFLNFYICSYFCLLIQLSDGLFVYLSASLLPLLRSYGQFVLFI